MYAAFKEGLQQLGLQVYGSRYFGVHLSGAEETDMTEIRQQAIALWILLMLLLMVPWALE